MKTILFVPGFRESLESRNYSGFLAAMDKQGFNTRFVDIEWAYSTPDDWAAQLNGVYSQFDSAEVVLAGFSFGAVTALISAADRNPSELWLFSLSPYFAEDFPLKPRWLSSIGKRRADYFSELSFNLLSTKISCRTKLWVGSEEVERHPSIGARAKSANSLISKSSLYIAQGADHDVAQDQYIKSIEEGIKG